MQIVNYFNPLATGFNEARHNFQHLSRKEKLAVVITSLAGAIFFLIGGVAAFRFAVEQLRKSDDSTADAVSSVASRTPPLVTRPSTRPRLPLAEKVTEFDNNRLHEITTVSHLHDPAQALREKRNQLPAVHSQGVELARRYYFQSNCWGGNCFYLGFTSGWLHHLLREQTVKDNTTAINDAVTLLRSFPNFYTAFVVDCLNQLNADPSLDTLYSILQDKDYMRRFTMCFREIAIHGINTIENPQKTGLQWDPEAIEVYIQMSENLRRAVASATNPDDRRWLYCQYQKGNGADIQPPEIAVLNKLICPISICGSMDAENERLRGFGHEYAEGNPITLFRWTDHYDTLIPK